MMNIQKPVDKKRKQIEEQIIYNIMQIIQNYPQYTILQHFCHFSREKGDPEDKYFWSLEKTLKKIEDYKDELDKELVSLDENE